MEEHESDVPSGWKTILEAAQIAGVTAKEIREWASQISPDDWVLPDGTASDGETRETLVRGRDCVRRLADDSLIVSDVVVEGWCRSVAELRATGWLSVGEVASELGLDKDEVIRLLDQRRTLDHDAEGWAPVSEAARTIGIPVAPLEQWAESIDPDADYLPNGRQPTNDDNELVKGSDCVRRLGSGELAISHDVMRGWCQVEKEKAALKRAGWQSVEEVAAELGIDAADVLERVELLEIGNDAAAEYYPAPPWDSYEFIEDMRAGWQDRIISRPPLKLAVSEEVLAKLRELKTRAGVPSPVDIVRRAIAVYAQLIEITADGNKVVVESADGESLGTLRIVPRGDGTR